MNELRQDLVATFAKSNGASHKWTYKGLDPTLEVFQIKDACELLTVLDIFEQDGVKLFETVVTAKIVTYHEELLFDPDHEPTDSKPANELEEATPKEPTLPESTVSDCTAAHCYMINQALPAASSSRALSLEAPARLSADSNGPCDQNQAETPIPSQERPEGTPSEGSESPIVPVKQEKSWRRLFHWMGRKNAGNKADPEDTS